MPTYDFKCLKCGNTFEMLQAPKAPYPQCLLCGHAETEKLLAPPAGIIFKGSGFYKTDFGLAHQERKEKTGESSSASDNVKKKDSPVKK